MALLEDERRRPRTRRRARRRLSSTALTASTIERNARVSRISVRISDQGEHVGEAAEQGVHEVAVDRGRRRSACRSCPRARRWRDRRSPGCRAPSRRSRGTPRPASPARAATSGARSRRRCRARCAASAATCCGVAAVLDEHVERLHHAGADVRRRRASGGRRSRCRCRGSSSAAPRSAFSCVPSPASTATIARPTAATATRAPEHEARPAAPGAVLGAAAVDRGAAASRGRC